MASYTFYFAQQSKNLGLNSMHMLSLQPYMLWHCQIAFGMHAQRSLIDTDCMTGAEHHAGSRVTRHIRLEDVLVQQIS